MTYTLSRSSTALIRHVTIALGLVLTALAVAGCQLDDSALIEICTSDDECAAGEQCVQGKCLASELLRQDTGIDAMQDMDDTVLDLGTPCGSEFCSGTEVCCENQCVDVASDDANCGKCGNSCGGAATCVDGACDCAGASCTVFESCCGTAAGAACIQTASDSEHCGQCGNICPENEFCVGGNCACQGPNGVQLCDDDQICCGDGAGCRDLTNDRQHCGACGVACGTGEVCENGTCVCGNATGMAGGGAVCGDTEACCGRPTPSCVPADDPICDCGDSDCVPGELCCDVDVGGDLLPLCVLVDGDEEHCGSCGNICAPAETCVNGACECEAGYADCNGDRGDGCEVRLDSDAEHCGMCDNNCDPGFLCDGTGNCARTCQSGFIECGGECVDPLTDREWCSSDPTMCGSPCDPGFICNGAGVCELSCQPDLVECGGECVDPLTDRRWCNADATQCGAACDDGFVCNGAGVCELSCQQGLTECGGECVDLLTDRAWCSNTGSCGSPCANGEVCVAGQCEVSCPGTQVDCNGECVDPQTNPDFCGVDATCGGGEVCDANEMCVGGSCTCEPGHADCDGSAANGCETFTDNDRQFCGADTACTGGTACADGEVCVSGSCQLNCPVGQVNCGGTCVDPDEDRTHCGAAGACNDPSAASADYEGDVCDPGEVCNLGTCELSCSTSLDNCSGSCVDVDVDAQNCGACGNDCSTKTSVVTGSCVAGSCQVVECAPGLRSRAAWR